MLGTASTVRAFLLVECRVAWGVDILHDARLPRTVRIWLAETGRTGVRPLLIRRHGRDSTSSVRVFTVYADPDHPWVETARLGDVREVTQVDVGALAAGRSPGLSPYVDPLFLVCTHGRHDVCCAETGRPVAQALSATLPDSTWEVSHIGGDRFAANVVVLPEGLYYGRVLPADAPALAAAHLRGRLDLAHLRGRSGYAMPVQAAEWFLRERLGTLEVGALWLRSATRRVDRDRVHGAGISAVVFRTAGRDWQVLVRSTRAEPQRLTCRVELARHTSSYGLVDIRELPARH
jgi:hypothetical protein